MAGPSNPPKGTTGARRALSRSGRPLERVDAAATISETEPIVLSDSEDAPPDPDANEKDEDFWFGSASKLKEAAYGERKPGDPAYLLFLGLNPSKLLDPDIAQANWTLYWPFATGSSELPRFKSFHGGFYFRVTGVEGKRDVDATAYQDEAAYEGEGAWFRVVNTADNYSTILHPQRAGREAKVFWRFTVKDDSLLEDAKRAILVAGKTRGRWADVQQGLSKGGQPTKELHLRIGFAEDSFDEKEKISVTVGEQTLEGLPTACCTFCLRHTSFSRHNKCSMLRAVNDERKRVHPEWPPVTILESGEIEWEDAVREFEPADFYALKLEVETLRTQAASTGKELDSLKEEVAKLKSAGEKSKEVEVVQTGVKRGAEEEEKGKGAKKVKKVKGPKA
ncbi:hypothetical protein TRAPUB_12876 [Trametes pubescens]|uniref:Uncharacterized protein n=1 Tax=Trametes pubescens TaxID=154538 RepID=A0A1M2VSL7_TRAPU|nr:hypothetical protein TRAPUB_12876 [Trametes pubescens]